MNGAEADRMIDEADGLIAPFHLPAEIGNVLLQAQRRGRLSEAELEEGLADLDGLCIEIDVDGQSSVRPALGLARLHKLTCTTRSISSWPCATPSRSQPSTEISVGLPG